MLDLFANRGDQNRLAREHWRVLVGATLVQTVGALVSALVVQPSGETFLNLWVGGAVASLPGALLGLAWHLASAERRASTSWPVVGFILAASAMLLVFALTFDVAVFEAV